MGAVSEQLKGDGIDACYVEQVERLEDEHATLRRMAEGMALALLAQVRGVDPEELHVN